MAARANQTQIYSRKLQDPARREIAFHPGGLKTESFILPTDLQTRGSLSYDITCYQGHLPKLFSRQVTSHSMRQHAGFRGVKTGQPCPAVPRLCPSRHHHYPQWPFQGCHLNIWHIRLKDLLQPCHNLSRPRTQQSVSRWLSLQEPDPAGFQRPYNQ